MFMRKDFSNLYTHEKAKNYIPTTAYSKNIISAVNNNRLNGIASWNADEHTYEKRDDALFGNFNGPPSFHLNL